MSSFRVALLSVACLAGCAAPPMGPTVQVMPAPSKPYNQFVAEDGRCRAQASNQVAGQAEALNNRAVGGAVLGTVLGAGLGAALGGGRGAAVGAATGAGVSTGVGAGVTANAQGGIQAQYDSVYTQCMYAAGNQIPGVAPVVGYDVVTYAAPAYGRDPLVRDIQIQLRRLGYYSGATDGLNGPGTSSAIQSFQASHQFAPDGAPSPYLLSVLQQTAPGY